MIEKPIYAESMEPYGSAYPKTSAMKAKGYFKIDEPGAIETPCVMVSIENTNSTMPKISRHQFAGVADLPNDNLNQPY